MCLFMFYISYCRSNCSAGFVAEILLIFTVQRLDDFLGVLGGNLGLYMGASAISLLEVVIFLLTGLFKIVTHMFQ
jgi:hypothetical protein